jgi:hypothetical protein
MAAPSQLNISVEHAESQYQVYLQSGVHLVGLSPEVEITEEKVKSVVGAIGTYQLKANLYHQRQEKLARNRSDQEKRYALATRENLNSAIDRMKSLFQKTGLCDPSLLSVEKIEEPPHQEDPLYKIIIARETPEKQSDYQVQQMTRDLVEMYKNTGLYEEALQRLSCLPKFAPGEKDF